MCLNAGEVRPKDIVDKLRRLEILKRDNFTGLSDIAYFKNRLLEIELKRISKNLFNRKVYILLILYYIS